MDSGMVALVNSESGTLENALYEYSLPENSPFDSITTTIRIDEELTLSRGVNGFLGRVAQEEVERVDNTKISGDGEILDDKTSKIVTRTTEFLLVPDEFLVVGSSDGEFFLPLLNEETSHTAFPAEISVDKFVEDHEEADYWKVGFTGRGDGAENGVLHGKTVFNDSEFGNIVGSSPKNQLGVKFEYKGEIQKIFLTESGYVNVYSSSESVEFGELILDLVMQYTRMA